MIGSCDDYPVHRACLSLNSRDIASVLNLPGRSEGYLTAAVGCALM
jgi:hypothetical protein